MKEREVAGIRCGEVLEHLGAYVDGELSEGARRRIEAHLEGCNWCESFGNEYAETVAALRANLGVPEPLSSEVEERLRSRLSE